MASIDSNPTPNEPKNPWVRRSIELANTKDYLDRLHTVYPVSQEAGRTLPPELKRELAKIYHSNDDIALVRKLLSLRSKYRFPIKDPYAAFLGKKPKFLEFNPCTVARIAQSIRTLGLKGMIASLEEPKEFNRQIGTLFKKWLPKLGYPFLSPQDFEGVQEIAFLQGSARTLQSFANEKLGCRLQKAPDFVAKVRKGYLVGEAKFLTDHGGHQNAQLEDALRFLEQSEGTAERIAVLAGVVWIQSNTKMYHRVCELEKAAMSALLLQEFWKVY